MTPCRTPSPPSPCAAALPYSELPKKTEPRREPRPTTLPTSVSSAAPVPPPQSGCWGAGALCLCFRWRFEGRPQGKPVSHFGGVCLFGGFKVSWWDLWGVLFYGRIEATLLCHQSDKFHRTHQDKDGTQSCAITTNPPIKENQKKKGTHIPTPLNGWREGVRQE